MISPIVFLTACSGQILDNLPILLVSNLKPIVSSNKLIEIQVPEDNSSESVKKELKEILLFQEQRNSKTIEKIRFWDGCSLE